jgi:hypothetical protein
VNQVEIQIFDSQISKTSLASTKDMLLSVVGVPKLGSNPEILSFYNTFIKNLLNCISAFLFITVIRSFINASVASRSNGIVDNLSDLILWNFPAAKANAWHFIST